MSLSDLSDLTDISSEEDDVPLAKSTQKPKKNAKSREYQITNTLRPPRTTQYTARSLYGALFSFRVVRTRLNNIGLLQTKSSKIPLILTQSINEVCIRIILKQLTAY